MNDACSFGSFDGFSAVTNAMRAVSSGTTATISLPVKPVSLKSCLSISRTKSPSRTFGSEYEVARVPAGSAEAAFARTAVRLRFTPATIRCFEVSSQAHCGTCGLTISISLSTTLLLNESDLVYFFKRRYPVEHLCERGVAQECHAFVMGSAFDFRCRPSL